MNKIFLFSLLTSIATWFLLIIGGLVNPMGASMACPDWYFFPTCNGEVFPPLEGAVLYEHGHRIMASIVGICTLTLTVLCLGSKAIDRLTKKLSLLALFLVILQGTLGGITVLLNLSVLVSTLHLLCAMVFFALLITISFKLSPGQKKPIRMFETSQWTMFLAITLTLIQLIFGGLIRHLGAGLACGEDLIGCGDKIWPSWFFGQIHMGHRFFGYVLFFLVLYASIKSRALALSKFDKSLASLSLLPIIITFCQIALGLLSIYTVRNPAVLALHTGFGALLLASLLTVYLLQLQGCVNNVMPAKAGIQA